MTIVGTVAAFLTSDRDKSFCDSCIKDNLGLKHSYQAQSATSALAVSTGFRKRYAHCSVCGKVRRVSLSLSASGGNGTDHG